MCLYKFLLINYVTVLDSGEKTSFLIYWNMFSIVEFLYKLGFDFIMAVKTSVMVFWVMMPCIPIGGYQRLREYITSIFRWYSLLKCWWLPRRLHGITTHKIAINICTNWLISLRIVNVFEQFKNYSSFHILLWQKGI